MGVADQITVTTPALICASLAVQTVKLFKFWLAKANRENKVKPKTFSHIHLPPTMKF